MATYGILIVEPTWRDQTTADLDKQTVQHHRSTLVNGAHALIYVQAPVDAIVGEAEIHGDLVETETVPPDPALNPAIGANLRSEKALDLMSSPDNPPDPLTGVRRFGKNYRIPLRIIRSKMVTQPIPINRIKALLGDGFETFDEQWIPLHEDDYRLLVREWGEAR